MGEPRLPSYPHPPSTFDQPTFSLTTLLFSVSLDRYLRSSLRYLPLLTASATIIVAVSSSPQPSQLQLTTINMATEEDLIDYSDEELGTNDAAPAAGANGGAKKGELAVSGGTTDKKGSYVGIHSTGFRDFLLKPELLRAITDCGFEHPSEGQS